MEIKIEQQALRRGWLTEKEHALVPQSMERISEWELYFDDRPCVDVGELGERAIGLQKRLRAQEQDLGLIVVDSVEALEPSRKDIARSLKVLAKELDVSVLALAHLTVAEDEVGWWKTPTFIDLRREDALDVHADLALIVRRDCIQQTDKGPSDWAEIMIAKNRNGSTGTVCLRFDKLFASFFDVTEEQRAEAVALRTTQRRDVFLACQEPFGIGRELNLLIHNEFPDGFTLEELLGHGTFMTYEREEIQRCANSRYKAFWIGSTFLCKRGDRCRFVDLDRAGTLFGPDLKNVVRILFDLPYDKQDFFGDEPSSRFNWWALAELIVADHEALVSWGDGWITNHQWLIRAPEPAGMLGLRFGYSQGGEAEEMVQTVLKSISSEKAWSSQKM